MPHLSLHNLDLQVPEFNVKRTFVKASGLSPIIKQGSQVLFEDSKTRNVKYFIPKEISSFLPSLALIVEENEDHLSNVVAQLAFGDPGRNLSEFLQIDSDIFHVKEEQASLQFCSSGQNLEEVLE